MPWRSTSAARAKSKPRYTHTKINAPNAKGKTTFTIFPINFFNFQQGYIPYNPYLCKRKYSRIYANRK